MLKISNSFSKDYEELLIKNDKLSEENRKLRYSQRLLEAQNNTLIKADDDSKNILLNYKKE